MFYLGCDLPLERGKKSGGCCASESVRKAARQNANGARQVHSDARLYNKISRKRKLLVSPPFQKTTLLAPIGVA